MAMTFDSAAILGKLEPVQALLTLLVLISITVGVYGWVRRDRRLDSIKGPGGYPLIGIGIGLPPQAPTMFRQWAGEYGELFKLRVGWYDWVVVNSPQAMREIFDRQSIHTSSKMPAPLGDDVVTGGMRMFSMPYGPKWRAYRTIVQQLVSITMTATFIPTQEYETKQLLFDLATDNDNQRDFYFHLRRFSFSIIMTSTYGTRINRWDHEDVHYSLRSSRLLGQISRPGSFVVDEVPVLARLPTWLQPGRRIAQEYAKPVLEAKMRLWKRLEAQLAEGKAPMCYGREIMESKKLWRNQGLTDADAAWIAGGMVEAGSETTSVTLFNLMLHLAANLDVQRAAHKELMQVVGPDRTPTYDDIQNLPYVRSCVKEILRLCPVPLWGMRHFSDADVVYKSHVIPKGTVLLANTSFLNYDPERYEDPFAFRPERYLNHPLYSAEYVSQRDPLKRDHFSFGVGRRVCPGARLAENSLNIAMANILWAFEIRPPLVGGIEADGMDFSEGAYEPTAFHAPKPFSVRFLPRSDERLRIIETQWEQAKIDGYILRGKTVDVNGILH